MRCIMSNFNCAQKYSFFFKNIQDKSDKLLYYCLNYSIARIPRLLSSYKSYTIFPILNSIRDFKLNFINNTCLTFQN